MLRQFPFASQTEIGRCTCHPDVKKTLKEVRNPFGKPVDANEKYRFELQPFDVLDVKNTHLSVVARNRNLLAKNRSYVAVEDVEKAEAAPPRQSSIITSLSQWGEQDLAAAVALSTSIPELQDPVGSACWKSWSAAGAVVSRTISRSRSGRRK